LSFHLSIKSVPLLKVIVLESAASYQVLNSEMLEGEKTLVVADGVGVVVNVVVGVFVGVAVGVAVNVVVGEGVCVGVSVFVGVAVKVVVGVGV
jgi:hypothetical protein